MLPGSDSGAVERIQVERSPLMERNRSSECRLALFIDFENIARGVRQRHLEERGDLRAILGEREEKGGRLVKRAYADGGYFKDYRSDLLRQGIEPVQVCAAARD